MLESSLPGNAGYQPTDSRAESYKEAWAHFPLHHSMLHCCKEQLVCVLRRDISLLICSIRKNTIGSMKLSNTTDKPVGFLTPL